MDKNTILFVIAALLAGFIAGFLLTNSINRSEINALRSQSARKTVQSNSNTQQEQTLSDDELKAKIAEADKNGSNFTFQKDLGVALYRYATMKQDKNILGESLRILERANSLNKDDFDVLVSLGNAYFDIAFDKKDRAGFQRAREIYTNALQIKPDDADVQTDVGISYYVQPTPDYNKAVAQLEKVVSANPTHTRSMQYLARSYIKLGKFTDAEKLLAKIKSIDPSEDATADLTSEIAKAKGGQSR